MVRRDPLLPNAGIVARREYRDRIRSPFFIVSTIVLMALAARKFGRPVKWIEDRLEHLAASSASSGRVTKVDGAFDRGGRA